MAMKERYMINKIMKIGGFIMFLSYLTDSNKEGFLKICVYAALSNEIFAEEEKATLDAYCREMNVEVHIPEISEPFEKLLEELKTSTTQKERNIIVLETLALIKSDGIYDDKEQSFMASLISGLNVSKATFEKFNKLLEKYTEIGKEMYEAIIEE